MLWMGVTTTGATVPSLLVAPVVVTPEPTTQECHSGEGTDSSFSTSGPLTSGVNSGALDG